jgi:cell division ATPase FtsA
MFEAEQMADVEIRSVYLGVSGGHIRGFNNRGVHPVGFRRPRNFARTMWTTS